MIQRRLHSKNSWLACWRRPPGSRSINTYILFPYATPYICYSLLLSGLYSFALRIPQRIRPGRLPRCPDPCKRPSRAGTTLRKSFGESPTIEATKNIEAIHGTQWKSPGGNHA